jgi:hypothetical protein
VKEHNIDLTSAELGILWSSYMAESASIPFLTYFTQTVEDLEIKSVLKLALSKSKEHFHTLTDIFRQENYPVPFGFSMEDVNIEAPRLYSDTYMLYFTRNYGKAGIAANGMAFSMAARKDIRVLYKHYLDEATMIEDAAKEVMLSKGVFIRPPYIAIPKEPDIIKEGTFSKGWLGERRTLTAQEIAHLFMNYSNSTNAKALLIGFAQTTQSKELCNYFTRGIEIARGLLEIFRTLFEESTLPSPMTWDTEVKDSTTAPFSDRIMLFHANQLNSIGIGNIGGSLALSMRRDLVAKYTKILKDIGIYAEDGLNLMIKHEWFERPPQAIDREYLTKRKNK